MDKIEFEAFLAKQSSQMYNLIANLQQEILVLQFEIGKLATSNANALGEVNSAAYIPEAHPKSMIVRREKKKIRRRLSYGGQTDTERSVFKPNDDDKIGLSTVEPETLIDISNNESKEEDEFIIANTASERPKHPMKRHFSLTNLIEPPKVLDRKRSFKSFKPKKGKIVSGRVKVQNLSEEDCTTQRIVELRSIGRNSGCAFYHDNALVAYWNWFIILMVVIEITVSPFRLSFHFEPIGIIVIEYVADVAFILDLFVNLTTTYIDECDNVVSNPSKMAAHYIKSRWFIPDFVSCFPYELFALQNSFAGLRGLKVLRLIRISKLLKNVQKNMKNLTKSGVFRFVRLFSLIFVISHWVACLWNSCATGWKLLVPNWQEKTLLEKYSRCLYTAISLLLISPPPTTTSLENLIAGAFIIVGAIVQASVFGSVAVLISSFDDRESDFHKKLIKVYERCTYLGVSPNLKHRIQEYYQMLWNKTRSLEEADEFIKELSPSLICEVKFHLFKDMILRVPFLSGASTLIVESLILKVRTLIYLEDDIIMRKGEYGDWMGIIGKNGHVAVMDPNSKTRRVIHLLSGGEFVGEDSLIGPSRRYADVVALTWLQMYALTKEDFDCTRQQYPIESIEMNVLIQQYLQDSH